jgi:hypothetical protein
MDKNVSINTSKNFNQSNAKSSNGLSVSKSHKNIDNNKRSKVSDGASLNDVPKRGD